MSLIDISLNDRILHLTFEDPSSRNSFSVRAAEELLSALETKSESTAGVLFSAKGRVFCSGGNLSDYAAMTHPEQGKAVNRRITEILQHLTHIGKPTVCAVGGDCFGGGVELVSAFDLVLAAPHVIFGFWQRRIGLSFGWGGGQRIEARIGTHALKRCALTSANLGAHEALSCGLIDGVVPDAFLLREARARLLGMMALPQAPVRAVKAWDSEREAEFFESLWWNDEHRGVLQRRR